MKPIRTLLLSGMVLVSVTGVSAALDGYGTMLPLQDSREASALHAYKVLQDMGGKSLSKQGDPSFLMEWDTPGQLVIFTSSKYGAVSITCSTDADPPAAKTLCAEVERRYLLKTPPTPQQ